MNKNFKIIFNPKIDDDVNSFVLKLKSKKEFENMSQIGLLAALNDAKLTSTSVYTLTKFPKIRITKAEFSKLKE